MKIIAHRGASGYAPENTLAAFAKAVRLGTGAVEFDVQQTRDHELVVIHDFDLKRVAGRRKSVGRSSYEDLAAHDVGSWFDPKFRRERVPRLAEVLDLLDGAKQPPEVQLELKHGLRPYPGIEGRVVGLLRSRGALGRVVVSSFNHGSLGRARSIDGELRLGYLVGVKGLKAAIAEAAKLGCESVHLSLRRVNRSWVETAHAAGMRLLIYTVNTHADLNRMRALGVDGVFSNFPDLA